MLIQHQPSHQYQHKNDNIDYLGLASLTYWIYIGIKFESEQAV